MCVQIDRYFEMYLCKTGNLMKTINKIEQMRDWLGYYYNVCLTDDCPVDSKASD